MSGFSHELPNDGKTVEWYTPAWIFEALGLSFDLDPCTPVGRVLEWIPAAKRHTVEDDGLRQPWSGRVWCNPPYGRETSKWLDRMGQHGNGIALVFARCDCAWFHDAAATAEAILFFRGRIRFVSGDGQPSGTPGAGSILIAWGSDNAVALSRMALAGHGCLARLRA